MGVLRYSAFLFLILTLFLPCAFGSGITFDGIGVKARGMGGAFRAVADDWSAAYYNPAGYNRLKDNVLAGNVAFFHDRYWAKPNISWGGIYESGFYNGQDVANRHAVLNVPQGGIVARLPVWGETVFGFAIIQQFDQNLNWQLYRNIPQYNQAAIPGTEYYNNLDVVAFQATAAHGFMNDRMSLGIGVQLLRADLNFSNLVLRDNRMPSPLSDRPYEKIPEWYYNNGSGWGFGIKGGLLYKVSEKMDAALVLTAPSKINLDGNSQFKFYMGNNFWLQQDNNYFPTTQEYLFVSGEVVDLISDFKTSLDLPASVGAGVAFKVTPRLTVDLDGEMIFWSSFKGFDFAFTNFSGLKDTSFHYANDSLFRTNMSSPAVWKDVGRMMLGCSYQANSFIEARAGFGFEQSPIDKSTMTPQFIDLGNKYSVSFGLGFAIGLWNLDIASSYTHQANRTISSMTDVNGDGLMDNLPADYRGDIYQTVLGISHRF